MFGVAVPKPTRHANVKRRSKAEATKTASRNGNSFAHGAKRKQLAFPSPSTTPDAPRPPSTLDASQEPDYYAILAVATSASYAEVKLAYHRALLLHHPDKQANADRPKDAIDVDLLKQAYTTLATHDLRRKYDASRKTQAAGPRPAQVVSLEEFIEHEDGVDGGCWTYDCRCGGVYRISEREMEEDRHLIGCNCCSEVVWVGYEVADDDNQ